VVDPCWDFCLVVCFFSIGDTFLKKKQN